MRCVHRLLLVIVLVPGLSFGQQFFRSKGLQLFNNKMYAEASDSIVAWAQDHTSEKGIAYYYAGECQYNLACESNILQTIQNHLGTAVQYFISALKQTDLSTLYPEKKGDTVYKLAWTYFRLGELDNDITDQLKKASQSFMESASIGNDSVKALSKFMMVESNLRRAQILRIQLNLSNNIGNMFNVAQEIVQLLHTTKNELESIEYPVSMDVLSTAAKFKMVDIDFELAKLYERLPAGLFNPLNDSDKKRTTELTSIYMYSNRVKYKSIISQLDLSMRNQFQNDILYSEAVKRLNLFLMTGSDYDKQSLNSILDSLSISEFQYEKAWMQGIRDFKCDVREDAFVKLADPKTSYFLKSASKNSEAWFWFGWVQYLSNDSQSRNSFERFIQQTENQIQTPRIHFLRDKARYLTYLIQFDHLDGKKSTLLSLKKELEVFKPSDPLLKDQSDLLLKLARLSLGETIWGKILNAATIEERFRDAFFLIQDALVRATRVTGKERVPYLKILDELFKITQDRRIEETAFYRGLALFLKAEIQETAKYKREFYMAAADVMRNVGGRFRNEAKYIEARSIFAGAKHGLQSRTDYLRAEPIFEELINNAKSLRSLFYLGEIYRVQENDLAARQCYQVVMEKTKENPEGNFWYQNAMVALGLCTNKGDAAAAQSARIHEVQFPENLLQSEDGEIISLERFADYDFIRRQYHDQAIDLYLQFAFPKRDLYPSEIRLNGSRFTERDFYPHNAGIIEKIGSIASGLKLFVIQPKGFQKNVVVSINGQILLPDNYGFYQKSPIPLNESAEIRITQQSFYPYIEQHIFYHPGIEQMVIPLIAIEHFIQGNNFKTVNNLIRFLKRSDRNAIFLSGLETFYPPSAMINDFEKDIFFRDFIFSKILSGYIAVHAKKDNPILYKNGGKSEFILKYPKNQPKIKTAEGITIDSKGNLYIVDWSFHQIVMFDSEGNYIDSFGSMGRNQKADLGKTVRLEFPLHIAIAEDREGVLVDNKRIYLPKKIFIADRNGIYMTDSKGRYWNSMIVNENETHTFSSLHVSGYDLDIQLSAYDRKSNSIIQFSVEALKNP